MGIYEKILANVLARHTVRVKFDNLKTDDPGQIVEMVCLKTIERIRRVLDNDELDDFECIERIVNLLENIGVGGASRHE